MPDYVWVSLGGALALGLSGLTGKIILRYRICDAGLVTWLQGLANAVLAGAACAALGLPFPREHAAAVASVAAFVILATWLLNHALQEGDASSVVPLMGLKAPVTAFLAVVWLGESATPATWSAVICSATAVSLFGVGSQSPAQGGHGLRPVVSIALVLGAAVSFSLSDLAARLTLDEVDPVPLVLWSNVMWAPVSLAFLTRPHYRQFRVTWLDGGLLLLRSCFVMGAVFGLYLAFRLADGVILPNVVYGTRGFFGLAAGYALGRMLRVPMERQTGRVYAWRTAATLLLFVAILLAVTA